MRRVGRGGPLVRRTIGRAYLGDGPLVAGEYRLPDAREKARLVLRDMERGIDPKVAAEQARRSEEQARSEAAKNSFGAVAAAYFADPSKRGGAGLKSKRELERKVRVDLAEWADVPIRDIRRPDVRGLIQRKATASPVAANRLLALVRRIFRWAVREDILEINPAQDIDPPTEERERERVLKLDELRQIWAASDHLGYPFGPIVKLLILTAQRRGEVGGMRWVEIDGDVWRLPDSRAKRGKGHLIPLSPRAKVTLSDLPRIGDKPDLVFSTGRRRRPTPTGQEVAPALLGGWSQAKARLDKIIAQTAAKVANEPVDAERHALPPWTLHDIRRSVATHLRDADVLGADRVDRLVVSKVLNHAEGGMTRLYDRYSADPEKRCALEAWSRRIEQLCGLNVVPLGEARA
jgi:integrase